MVLGFTGFVLSAVAISGCNFFEISTFWIYGSVSVGVFEYELVIVDGLLSMVNGYGDIEDITIRSVGCKAYPGNPPKVDSFLNVTTPYQAADLLSSEGSFKAAKAFGFLSALISGLAMITCFLMLFLKLPRWAFKTVAGMVSTFIDMSFNLVRYLLESVPHIFDSNSSTLQDVTCSAFSPNFSHFSCLTIRFVRVE